MNNIVTGDPQLTPCIMVCELKLVMTLFSPHEVTLVSDYNLTECIETDTGGNPGG